MEKKYLEAKLLKNKTKIYLRKQDYFGPAFFMRFCEENNRIALQKIQD